MANIEGGAGGDSIYGDRARTNDSIGNDTLAGGDGNDRLDGGAGNDLVKGEAGDDVLAGDAIDFGTALPYAAGDDTLDGGIGNDVIYGDGYTSYQFNQALGNDYLAGGDGDDVLFGDTLESFVTGDPRPANDTLAGGKGNDTLYGDAVVNYFSPWRGADVFEFAAEDGLDTIVDFRSVDGDVIDLAATGLAWANLDTNSNNVLDDGDDYVASDGSNTQIDLGAATGASLADLNVVSVAGVTGLTAVDFVFA